jgi:hypothetical protein
MTGTNNISKTNNVTEIDKRNEKILYWAKQLEHKSLSVSELVENVNWLRTLKTFIAEKNC